jgi:hypothetical protein
MSRKILVVLKRCDQASGIVPCLEKLITPGMTVVFVIRYPVELQQYLRDHWVTTESAGAARLAGRKIMHRYSWAAQRELAEEMIISAREALYRKGVQVQVCLYTGSLRRTVLTYTADSDPLWILIPAQGSHGSGRLLERAIAPFDWFKFVFYYGPILRLCGPVAPMVTVVSLESPTKRTGLNRPLAVRANRVPSSHPARIIHDLRNYISALLLGIETFETCPGHVTPCTVTVETLQNLGYKMSCLLEKLEQRVGEQDDPKETGAPEFSVAKDAAE